MHSNASIFFLLCPTVTWVLQVAPMVKEKLAEALKNARVDTSDVNWEQRLAALSEEHEAELAEVRLSAAEQKRKVEVLEKQLEDSPFTTPASTARNPSQEAFEELLRRAQWLEKRLKEAEEREDELLEQKETSDRAQALLETQMASISTPHAWHCFGHCFRIIRWPRHAETRAELSEADVASPPSHLLHSPSRFRISSSCLLSCRRR